MIAAITNEAHGFDVVDLPEPVPGPEEVVIRVAACGVCGSDVKAQPFAPPGMVMGHEFGGEIVAVGSTVDGLKQGTNAAVLPVISCGECAYCRSGAVAHCPRVQYIGMGQAGGFAEFAVVPARHAFPLPPEVPATLAALVEPFAVGLHAVHSAELRPGDDVLIVGAGGVGLTTLVWTLRKGGARVTVADPDPGRRETALAAGATDVVAAVSDAEPGGYDLAIECVGRPELVQACQPSLRAQGRLVISGACAEPTVIEPVAALLKELTIRYSVAYRPIEFQEVTAAFAAGDIDPTSVIGPVLGLGRLGEAFDLVRTGAVRRRVLVSINGSD
ncbi:MAG TPA: alcohol dehydrogenase catalytic domain-containing protein [Jatrophihabitans sp.]